MNTEAKTRATAGPRTLTGPGKALLYARIAFCVVIRYALRPKHFGWCPARYLRFLHRALRLLLIFRHNKPVHTSAGWKLHLYVPAYPSRAFFTTLESKLLRTPPAPTTVVFSMTKACRYHCPHCYQRFDTGADLPEAELFRVARRLQDMGVALFDIEGGEPFCRFDRLLGLVQALDSRSEIWVNTSGDGATADRLRQLRDAGVFGLMVSIHSPDPALHDAFTGVAGSFRLACECLETARAHGLACAVNSVLSEAELRSGQLPTLMDLARDLGCVYVQLIHPKPAGGWLCQSEGMQRDAAVIDQVRAEHCRSNSRAAQAFEEAPGVLGCTAGGIDRFYVNAHGELQPCEFLNLSFGNLVTEDFDTVFGRMREAFPDARCDWLCCTQAAGIQALANRTAPPRTPVPWDETQTLVRDWHRGRPTAVYRGLGIYPEPATGQERTEDAT
jgi:MoaA/NifB/PqqE/SkfB family radical SAM enzyme